ncbi:MAG: zinc-ribbon domain-containing protein [Lachnospiraceae bacterium]|nr:zinc-ribbon domain-containing protein [Lachnospiraceae bacterium]
MICPKCGNEIAEGLKFCPNCGNPLTDVQSALVSAPQPEQQPAGSFVAPPQSGQQPAGGYVQPPQGYQQPAPGYQQPQAPYGQPPQKKSKVWLIVLIIVLVIAAILIIAGIALKRAADRVQQELNDQIMSEIDDINLDDLNLDLDTLNSEIEEIGELDLDLDNATGSTETSSGADESYSYDYVDVSYSGNTVTITPNGKLNGSTVLWGGKDLDGLCDYIDDEVLEAGRYINRDLLYDLIAIDVVDESMYTEFEDIELNLLMACALANNFHDTDVRVRDCVIDSAKPTDYAYDVKAYGKDDTWIINYKDKTVYFNNGGTEYVSDMFNDDYMVVWMVAVEEYYGIEAD